MKKSSSDELATKVERMRSIPRSHTFGECRSSAHLFQDFIVAARQDQLTTILASYPNQIDYEITPFMFGTDHHVFTIKKGEDPELFGCVLQVPYEGVDLDILNYPLPPYDDISFCFTSRTPQFNLLFKLLETVEALVSHKIKISLPAIPLSDDTFLTDQVTRLLTQVYNSNAGNFLTLGSTFRQLLCPFKFDLNQFGQAGYDVLFSHLSAPEIVSLYSALLLEEQIIVYAPSSYDSSVSVLACVALVAPFSLACPVLPTLPNLDILESPFPFLVGVTSYPDNIPDDVTVVDLVRGKVKRQQRLVVPNAAAAAVKLAKISKSQEIPRKINTFWHTIEANGYTAIPDFRKSMRLNVHFDPTACGIVKEALNGTVDFCFGELLKVCFVDDLNLKKGNRVFMDQMFEELYEHGNPFVHGLTQTNLFQMHVNAQSV